ncbi:MAG: response regulator [Bacteroidota bacterium]
MAKKTVLVIDDERSSLQFTQLVLEREGFLVISANDGRQGFELAKQLHPDMVVCDIVMPGLDGFQTLELFKTDSLLAKIRWVFISGNPDIEAIARRMNLRMEDFILKPFSVPKLLAAISAKP